MAPTDSFGGSRIFYVLYKEVRAEGLGAVAVKKSGTRKDSIPYNFVLYCYHTEKDKEKVILWQKNV